MRSLLTFLVLLWVTLVQAVSSRGSRLLAILDEVEEKSTYSKFLGDLEARGYQITYSTPKTESLSLFHLGERNYDHVILFPTKVKGLGPSLTPAILLGHLNATGSILVALSPSHPAPSSLVALLAELDVSLPADRSSVVVDHFAYDAASAADAHDVLVLSPPSFPAGVKNYFAGGSEASAPLAVPRAVGQLLGAGPLLAPILKAPRTAYSHSGSTGQAGSVDPDDLFGAGAQLALVSAVQARNSARLVVVGSAEMLSNAWFDGAKVKSEATGGKQVATGNREFARRVAAWCFHELGVLRVNWIEHRLNEEGALNATANPKIYRVKNDATYSISLSEYEWDSWKPFVVPEGDELQLEFSMLSPFYRLPLAPKLKTADATTYSVAFKLPDQHGIFNFKVNYKRPFLTNIEEKNTVSVRHMAHNEWPRSFVISGAWPWIAGIAVTVLGWLSFCAVWLYSKPEEKRKGETKKTQ